MTGDYPPIVAAAQVARSLRVSHATICRLFKRGDIPTVGTGREYFAFEAQVLGYLADNASFTYQPERLSDVRMLLVGEIMEKIGLSQATVYRHIAGGTLGHVVVGASIRVPEESAAAYISERSGRTPPAG